MEKFNTEDTERVDTRFTQMRINVEKISVSISVSSVFKISKFSTLEAYRKSKI